MKFLFKILIIIVAAVIVISSYFIISFYINSSQNDDTFAPVINETSGNINAVAGDTIEISVDFFDNVGVTYAELFYKSESETNWNSMSILNGSINLSIPLNPVEDIHYYILINDAADNGPVGDPSVDGSEPYYIRVKGEDDNGEDDIFHTVFIEEATQTTCKNCPTIGKILSDLYENDEYDFYYVSMIEDKNSRAHDRLYDDYNILGFPTVFIDGGYKVLYGGLVGKSEFEKAIKNAELRAAPNIKVNLNAEYDNITEKLLTKVTIENKEGVIYEGSLKVYLTEILSRWNNYDGKKYDFGFLDYVINKGISISPNDNISVTGEMDISDYDYQNLMVIAVVFNSEYVPKYSYPNENRNPFNAYYADATDATKLSEIENLPPDVGILNIKSGRIHLFGRAILMNLTAFRNTYLFGSTTINAYAEDDSSIIKVEFYLDGELMETVENSPYDWTIPRISIIKKIFPRLHTVEVKAYDDTDKVSSAIIEFYARL